MRLPGHLQTRLLPTTCDYARKSGMEAHGEMYPIAADDLDGLCALARDIRPIWLFGPEVPLVEGLADRLAGLTLPYLARVPPPLCWRDLKNLPVPLRASQRANQPFIR